MSPQRPRPAMRSVILWFAGLALVLLGCGSASTAPSATVPSGGGGQASLPSPTATDTIPAGLSLNGAAAADVSDAAHLVSLHVQTETGLVCQAWVVLKGKQHAFDAGTIQHMATYLHQVVSYYTDGGPAVVLTDRAQQSSPPPGLAAVLGSAGPEFGIPGQASTGSPNCDESLEVTNTGSTPVTIVQVVVTYKTASTSNPFTYQLIDLCTVVQCGPCNGCGSQAGCILFVPMLLQPGPADTQASYSVETNDPTYCSASAPLNPGAIGGAYLIPTSALPSQSYQVSLALAVSVQPPNEPVTTVTVSLPSSFDSNVVFAVPSQFTCYALQNGPTATFVPEPVPNRRTCI
jgi:hypothetical protein